MKVLTAPVVSDLHAVTICLRPGEDLKANLDEYVKTQNIKAAGIITCVDSLQQAAIRYANQLNIDISDKTGRSFERRVSSIIDQPANKSFQLGEEVLYQGHKCRVDFQ